MFLGSFGSVDWNTYICKRSEHIIDVYLDPLGTIGDGYPKDSSWTAAKLQNKQIYIIKIWKKRFSLQYYSAYLSDMEFNVESWPYLIIYWNINSLQDTFKYLCCNIWIWYWCSISRQITMCYTFLYELNEIHGKYQDRTEAH